MKTATKNSVDNIMSCFTGSDGCVAFVKLRFFLDHLDAEAEAGDRQAEQVVNVVHQMSRLIDIAQKG